MLVSLGAGEQDSRQLGLHLGIRQIRRPFFGHDDNVLRRQKLLVAPEKLPEEALHPVAAVGFTHLAPRHQPQPGAFAISWGQADAEVRRVQSFSPCLGPQVLLTAADPLVSGKAGRLWGCGGFTLEASWVGGFWGGRERCSLKISHREAFPALGPAALQHPAPALAAHAGQEAVGARPLEPARLIRAFHGDSSLGTIFVTNFL